MHSQALMAYVVRPTSQTKHCNGVAVAVHNNARSCSLLTSQTCYFAASADWLHVLRAICTNDTRDQQHMDPSLCSLYVACHCLAYEGLASARGTKQEDAFGRRTGALGGIRGRSTAGCMSTIA